MPRGYPALNETQKKEIIRRVTDGGEKHYRPNVHNPNPSNLLTDLA